MKSTEETTRLATINTWKEFLANFLGTTVPFIIIFAVILVMRSWGDLRKPLEQGDFLLYATSFWVYSEYLVSEKISEENGLIAVFGAISWLPILITGVFYLVLFLNPSTSLRTALILSLITFIPSTVFLFRNILKINIQKCKEIVDPKKIEQESINAMLEDLENDK